MNRPGRRDDDRELGEVPRMPTGRHRRFPGRDSTTEGYDQPRPVPLSARDQHELARMRAKVMSPGAAYAELIEGLNFAHVQAGKPSLSTLSQLVEYSKATLSKVLTGKAMPSWVLVRRLGHHLRVHPQVVTEWYTLWTAANMSGRKPGTIRASAPVPPAPGTAGATGAADEQTGYTCPKCGSWVINTSRHTSWHMEIDPSGRSAPPGESITGWNAPSEEISLLREALGDKPR